MYSSGKDSTILEVSSSVLLTMCIVLKVVEVGEVDEDFLRRAELTSMVDLARKLPLIRTQ